MTLFNKGTNIYFIIITIQQHTRKKMHKLILIGCASTRFEIIFTPSLNI